ncbi:MAG: Em GEA1 (EM1) [Chloroflexi bacterium]|nr:Em GEA1 (EM1) [Chloroflexota bacterium]
MVQNDKRAGGAMTVAEAGRMGGRPVREKYGPQHFERIGRKGGQKVAGLIERAKSLEGSREGGPAA